ncbi:MAG: glycosyltransferase family 2 protein [Candidatus Melainabacteria bacterium]|nr:MAG: glycosyltransferase family 2 protein [Candidatus Melainabacteria bacterium]
MPQISVIIPAYNEVRRLPHTLALVYNYLKSRFTSFELIVVDDGSYDHTADYVDDFSEQSPEVRLISYVPNKGKGHAVRIGMLAASGDLILFDDADGSSPIEELEKLLDSIKDGADIAIGSRAKPDDRRTVNALAHRKYLGNTFNAIVQGLLLPGFYDTQCGFKLFKKEMAHDIFSVTRLDRFAFDVEVLYVARLRDYKITEIPINWTNVEGSKVNVFTDSPQMLIEVLGVAIAAWTGRYSKLINKK